MGPVCKSVRGQKIMYIYSRSLASEFSSLTSSTPLSGDSTSTKSPSSTARGPAGAFCCFLHKEARKLGVLACSTLLSLRALMNLGKRRLRPRFSEINPLAATDTGLSVMLRRHASRSEGLQESEDWGTHSAPFTSHTSFGLKYTSGRNPEVNHEKRLQVYDDGDAGFYVPPESHSHRDCAEQESESMGYLSSKDLKHKASASISPTRRSCVITGSFLPCKMHR